MTNHPTLKYGEYYTDPRVSSLVPGSVGFGFCRIERDSCVAMPQGLVQSCKTTISERGRNSRPDLGSLDGIT